MISKYEATGIFISIALMALALAFLRFHGTDVIAGFGDGGDDQAAAVLVSTADAENDTAVMGNALKEASNSRGLQKLVIDDVRIGTQGKAVEKGDTVTVHYIGATQDGVQFDNSYTRGEAFTFTVGAGKVIEGWEQGLIGMKVGGQRVLVIPPSMAYGNAQVGPIAPNSTLVFTVELLEIE